MGVHLGAGIRCRMAATIRYRMAMRKQNQRPLTPDDWAQAALQAIARGGVEAVAVEPLAAELGTTKGSFYWHFESRDALVEAALREWERIGVDAVIEALAGEPDPATRLRKLFATAMEMAPSDRSIEVAVLAKVDHAAARRAVRRVGQRRIAYMVGQLEQLGWTSREAHDRAAVIAWLYIGCLQSAHLAPRAARPETRRRRMELIFDAIVGGQQPPRSARRARASGTSPVRRRGSRRPSKSRPASRRQP